MIAAVVGWVLLAAWSMLRRRPPTRVAALAPAVATKPPVRPRWPESVTLFGRRLDLPAPPGSTRTWRVMGVLWIGTLAVAPQPVVGVTAVATVSWLLRVRSDRRRRDDRIRRTLPECLDVIGLTVRAGLVPSAALGVAAGVVPEPLAAVFSDAVHRLERGASWPDVVAGLGRELGPDGRGLVLLLSGDGGAPLADGVDRVAAELRDRRHREVQRRAQRLPVVVLAPLVSCVLPAFILITIVPVVSTLGRDVIDRLPLGSTP